MKQLIQILKLINQHPLTRDQKFRALLRWIRWQMGSRLISEKVMHTWIKNITFLVGQGETGLTGNLYVGLHEFTDMAFVLHFTRKQDWFVDVGANAGSYTLLCGGVCGARGYAIEPIPETFQRLRKNIQLNDLETRVQIFNVGMGSRVGYQRFSSRNDCMNRIIATKHSKDFVQVRVETLDRILKKSNPRIMKIDVEGYEVPVLQGAHHLLEKRSMKAILIETNDSGQTYGFTNQAIATQMLKHQFKAYEYDPWQRRLKKLEKPCQDQGNTLFIRDLAFVQKRVEAAPRVEILGHAF